MRIHRDVFKLARHSAFLPLLHNNPDIPDILEEKAEFAKKLMKYVSLLEDSNVLKQVEIK